MKLLRLIIICYLSLTILIPKLSFAHSGNTDSYGCHNDYINGGYHCHNSKSSDSGSDGIVWGALIALVVIGGIYYIIHKENFNKPYLSYLDNRSINEAPFKFKVLQLPEDKAIGLVFGLSYEF